MKTLYSLRLVFAALLLLFAYARESSAQTLTSPISIIDVYPGESVQVSISGVLPGVEYVLVNEDDSEMCLMSKSGTNATASCYLPEGRYRVRAEDGSWTSAFFLVELHLPFRYRYPELLAEYSLPPSGGSITICLSERVDMTSGESGMISDDDSWYQLYDPLAQWNASNGYNNQWNSAFSWEVSCEEQDLCILITVSAPANISGTSRSAVVGLYDGLGHASVITQEPMGTDEDDNDEQEAYIPYAPAYPSDLNWVAVRRPSSASSSGEVSYAVDVEYYNGLGLLAQNVSAGASHDGVDIPDLITTHRYDGLLREREAFLPYALIQAKKGDFVIDVLPGQEQFYSEQYDDCAAYSETQMEFTPSGRVIGATLPGECYQGHGSNIEYVINERYEVTRTNMHSFFPDSSSLRFPQVVVLSDGSLRVSGFREEGSLIGTKSTDGDGRVSVSWKDGLGNLVAQDNFTGDTLNRVLYIRDDRGRMVCVMTGEGYKVFVEALEDYYSENIDSWDGSEENDWLAGFSISRDSDFAHRYCYLYTYDGLGRVIAKSLPGRDEDTFSYDELDRMVTSQDGNQRDNGITIHYSYDGIGRLLSKEAVKGGVSRPMVTYSYNPTTGLKTGETVYVLTGDGWVSDSRHITRNFSYDTRERVTGVVETESSGDYILTSAYTYDLADNILSITETCELGNGDQVTVLTSRSYDSRSRLTGEAVSVNGVQKSSVSIAYDELGRPCRTTYGSGSNAITESTAYTIQGWTASKWSDLLRQSWHY
ncbi:MAG: DUF6443 domain-containing protein, partial [Candidatus Cryptobacteroides sp.]|nr:DUF6443 domain-containing protein [Candidatus Cryptobacteroides sp.]